MEGKDTSDEWNPDGNQASQLKTSELRKRTKAKVVEDLEYGPTNRKENGTRGEILYKIDDCPPWHLTLLFGFQHYLLIFGGSVTLPLIVMPAMCMGDDDIAKSEVMSTVFFIAGISTLLQTTFGTRLPIVQGGSFSFLPPILAVLSLPKWQCPVGPPDFANLTSSGATSAMVNETLLAWRRGVWMSRMNEIQGSMVLASIFQIVVGLTGILGFLLRFIGPLSIAPTISLIGLHLFIPAADYCAQHWGIAFMTIALITIFSQYLRNIQIPFPIYNRSRGCHIAEYPIFKLLPVFLAIVITWCFCAILTVRDVFPSDPSVLGYGARTDIKLKVLEDAKWFRFPYPGQWGMPTASAAAVLGMLAGVIAGIIESVGDYYACARLSEAPPPPVHALNRGMLFEGIGIAFAGLWGSTSGVTSYSENVGAIGITKVASRRVIQVGALMTVAMALLGKFGALFITIPEPIIGGIFMVLFGMITAVGVSSLQFVDLNSSRNLFIFGFSVFLGLSLPHWVGEHSYLIDTGYAALDQVLFVSLNTPMLIGGLVGFFFDNTIPGTPEERGLIGWRGQNGADAGADDEGKSTYDLPFGMSCIRKAKWLRFFPICPTYKPTCECCTGCLPTRGEDSGNQEEAQHVRHIPPGYVNPVMHRTTV